MRQSFLPMRFQHVSVCFTPVTKHLLCTTMSRGLRSTHSQHVCHCYIESGRCGGVTTDAGMNTEIVERKSGGTSKAQAGFSHLPYDLKNSVHRRTRRGRAGPVMPSEQNSYDDCGTVLIAGLIISPRNPCQPDPGYSWLQSLDRCEASGHRRSTP